MRWLLCLLALTLALAAPLAADEEAARYFTERGRKALSESDWKEAEKNFRKAIVEKADFLPALLGLAEAVIGCGDREGGIVHLEVCLEQGHREPLSPEEREALDRAVEIFKKLDRPRYEYRKLVGDYVARLLALARQHQAKSPALARRCLERVAKVCPDHPEAKAFRVDVGTVAAVPKASEDEIPLFNGEDLEGWSGGPPVWSVKDGVFVARVGDGARWIRHNQELEGDYTLLFDVKVAKDTGPHPRVALCFGLYGPYEYWSLDVFKGSLTFTRHNGSAEEVDKLHKVHFYELKGGFDRQAWNAIRICVKGGKVMFMVNDRKLHEHKPASKSFDGFVGLVVQDCTAEFRKISLLD
ncbi:MAG: family 16 glycoside hydrolase [Planctomycetota bacterium]|jgi:tetratricopeptide (TPR) repeat protein